MLSTHKQKPQQNSCHVFVPSHAFENLLALWPAMRLHVMPNQWFMQCEPSSQRSLAHKNKMPNQRISSLPQERANPPKDLFSAVPSPSGLQVRLMHAHSKRSNSTTDLKSMCNIQQLEPPIYRVLSLFRDCCEPDGEYAMMLRRCVRNITNLSLWRELEPTELTSTDIFRLCLRPAAVVFELLLTRHKGFPFCLFHILENTDAAPALLEKATLDPCLLDEMSSSILSTYNKAELLESENCHQELSCLALHIMGNTWEIESAHAKHRRRVKGAPQTHVPSVADVALWNTGWGAPSYMRPIRENCGFLAFRLPLQESALRLEFLGLSRPGPLWQFAAPPKKMSAMLSARGSAQALFQQKTSHSKLRTPCGRERGVIESSYKLL